MGNQLFQKARKFVDEALRSGQGGNSADTDEIAKNALSSAYANASNAEREQLRELQEKLDNRQ